MLRFFRTLRRKLLADNRFTQYGAYAIGEIVLVVLGILIALQINTWNENRQNRQREADYLQRLQTELLQTIAECDDQIQTNSRQAEYATLIVNSLSADPRATELPSLVVALKRVCWFHPINITRNTWEELISTGNISLLHREALKADLAKFYSTIDFTLDIERECQGYYLGFKRSVGNLLSTPLQMEISTLEQGDPIASSLPDEAEFLARLKALEPFDGYLADLIECRQFGERRFVEHKADAEAILSQIEMALEE